MNRKGITAVSVFIENKYTTWYFAIISRAQLRHFSSKSEAKDKLGYVENHHIIPKSIGGLNNKNNLVLLTAREHFICHWLLIKMTTDKSQRKMIFALQRMKQNNPYQTRYNNVITNRVYANYKQIISQMLSEQKQGKRCLHSEETKLKISLGNKGKIRDQKFKENVRKVHKGKIESDETKRKKSNSRIGKKHSPETLKKLSQNSRKAIPITYQSIVYPSLKVAVETLFPGINYSTAKRKLKLIMQ